MSPNAGEQPLAPGRDSLRWLGISLGFVGALSLLSLWFLHSTYFREFVRSQLESALDEASLEPVRVGTFRGSLFNRFQFASLAIGPAGAPKISASSLTVDLSPWSLFSGRFRVEALALADLKVTARRESDGHLNLQDLVDPNWQPPDLLKMIRSLPVDVQFDSVRIDGGTIWVVEETTTTTVAPIGLEGSALVEPDKVEGAVAIFGGPAFLDLSAEVEFDRVAETFVFGLFGQVLGAKLNLSGDVVSDLTAAHVKGEIKTLDPARFHSAAPSGDLHVFLLANASLPTWKKLSGNAEIKLSGALELAGVIQRRGRKGKFESSCATRFAAPRQ